MSLLLLLWFVEEIFVEVARELCDVATDDCDGDGDAAVGVVDVDGDEGGDGVCACGCQVSALSCAIVRVLARLCVG